MSKRMQTCDGTEKVKRRMIRTIGRLLQEKKPQDEIWEYMEKEFGKKCKVLWDRMRVLTLKKLKCLFNALDVMNNVPKMARMTLTDWLIFDLVLVHEKFDVIDMKSIRDNKPSKVLRNLFSLILRFEIEGRKGEELANAWIAATVHYNSLGHQCSPMLLQRRWYQLKELTRSTFYKFWFIFRGNQRQLNRAKEDSPISALQRDIALRYSHLITQPFVEWSECIKNRTVIMPDEFETKMRNVTLMKPSDLSVPDVVLIEPKISTIDLCDDSDIEEVNEDTTKDNVTETDTKEPKTIEVSPVTIKSEPIDLEDDLPQDAQNLEDTQVEKNDDFDEEIQRLQLVENEIIIDSDGEGPTDDRENETNTPDGNEESARESIDGVTDEKETQVTTEENIVDSLVNAATESQNNNIIEVENTSDVNQEQFGEIQNDNATNNESDESEANLTIKSENIEETNLENFVESVDLNNETANQPDLVVKVEKDTLINEANTEATYPVIATVSSAGVPVNMETAIEGHSNNETPMDTDDVTENDTRDTQIDENDFRDNYIIGQSEDSNKIGNLVQTDDKEDSSSEEDIIKLPFSAVKNDVLQYNDVIPHDLEFADDGIQLVDDGIEFGESDEGNYNKTEDEHPKIDQKLLMIPVVYTTKLDHMMVFKQRLLFDGVNQKEVLEKICIESKPISKLAIKIEPEEITKDKIEEQYEENIFKQPLTDVDVLNKPVMVIKHDELPIKEEPQDLEENTPLDSSEDEVEVPRIKSTSYLLRKPRRRSYNPIKLCKNPDFNTRLKRLPVSFFTSQRNRFLLNECKPMTIDVCKAFESKLYNGTLYLTYSGHSSFTSPVKDNNVDTVPTVSVIAPSATPVQSLMDIDKLLEDEQKKRMGERNRTINLPDITEVRRINQHLLTAEVTPLRISPATSPVNENASIVIEDDQTVSRPQGVTEKVVNEDPVLPKIPPNPIIRPSEPLTAPPKPTIARPKPETSTNTETPDPNNSQNTTSLNKIRKQNRKTIHPPVSWRTTKTLIDNSDLLLTTDTLYKMLFAIDPNGVKSSSYNKYVSDNIKSKVVLQKKTIFTPKGISHKKTEDAPIEITDDANPEIRNAEDQNQEEGQEKALKAKVKVVYDRTKFVKRRRYCCWASARMDQLNGITTRCRPHKCRERCVCCCKLKLADMISTNNSLLNNANESNIETPKETEENEDNTIKNACDSIESVVQQTRELSQGKAILVPAATKLNDTELDVVKATTGTQVDLTMNEDTPTGNTRVAIVDKRNILKPQPPPREPTLLEKLAEAQSQAKILKRPPMLTKTMKQLSGCEKTQWTLCPCKRPVLKLSDQRTIVVDGTTICPYHPNKRRDNKRGQLYISRQGKSERPIFIGKNKLLLTNVKRPDVTSIAPPLSPSLVTVPAAENLQIPEGVQIVLLPNANLTYTIADGANVTAEQLSVMPTILAAVQAQINSGNLAVIDPNAGGQKEHIKEASDIIGFQEGEQGAASVESVPFPALERTPSLPAETINLSNEESNNTVSHIDAEDTSKNIDEATLIEPNKTDNTLLSPNKATNAPEAASISPKTNETLTENDEENDEEENKLVIDENINKHTSTTQEPEANSAESLQNSETNETETATQKNRASLLSDLMEMSGICEEDIASAAAPAPVPQHVPISVDVQERTLEGQSRFFSPPPLSPLSQSPKKSDIKDVYANLSTVNSFAELKYSYNNNGLFFKLDLDSGVIVPITLCIKKKQTAITSSKPTSVIDLTDDVDEENIEFNTENNPTRSDNILASKVFKRVLTEVKTAKHLNLKRVKPNVLQKAFRLTPNQRSLLKSYPKPRKIGTNKVDAQIDLVDSDNPMEEEYLQSSNDDTSDDEPLAKKVKRATEQRKTSTPVQHEAQIDSKSDRVGLELVPALEIGEGLDLQSLQESDTEDSEIIPAPTLGDSEEDSEIVPAATLGDSEMISAPTIETPTVQPSAVTMDDPKPTHLVLTRDDHHETVPIDSYFNDDGDDEDSQDCILGV